MKMKASLLLTLVLLLTAIGAVFADTLELPPFLEVIEEEAFMGDTSLDVVVLPESVTTIGARAFANSSVTQINLPDAVELIGEGAFSNAENVQILASEGSVGYQYAMDNELPITGKRTLTGEVYPVTAGSVIFYTENYEENLGNATQQKDGTKVLISYNKKAGYEFDKILYKEAGDTEYRQLTGTQELTVNGKNIHVRIEFKVREAAISDFTFETLTDGTCRVSAYAGSYTNFLSIPSAGPGGCVVTEVGQMANDIEYSETGGWMTSCSSSFYGTVIVPSTVKVIKENAFICGGVTEISLPDGLETIERNAFSSWGFTKIHIPDSVTTLGSGLFSYNNSLEEINYPRSLNEIIPDEYGSVSSPFPHKGYGSIVPAFTSIVIPEGVTFLPDNIFYYSSIQNITLPSSLTSIGEDAFADSSLKEIRVPSGVTSIGNMAFYNCDDLEFVVFENGVQSLGNAILNNCDNLRDVYFPASIRSVQNPLDSQNLPNYQTRVHCVRDSYIWNWFAANSYGLLEDTLIPWDETIPVHTPAVDRAHVSITVTDLSGKQIQDVLVTITNSANENEIYKGITNYDGQWTVLLPQDTTYTVVYSHDDYTINGSESIAVTSESLDLSVTAEVNEVLNQKYFTFEALDNGTCRITHFSDFTGFSSWNAITDVLGLPSTGPDGCIITEISSMKSNGSNVSLDNLKKVIIPSTVKIIRENAFDSQFKNVEEFILPIGLTTLESGSISGSMNSLYLPDSITTLHGDALYNCSSLLSVNFPISLQNIPQKWGDEYGRSPFPASVQNIEIPNGVTVIPAHAFNGLNLSSITLPESLTSIGNYAFKATPMRYLRVPDAVITMSDNVLTDSNIDRFECSYAGYAWKWAQQHGYKDILVGWNNIGVSSPDLFTYTSLGGSTCRVSGYTGDPTDWLTIPSEGTNGCTVTEVGPLREADQLITGTYDYVSYFNTVYVPSTVRTIREGAFTYGQAKEIILSEGLTTIENYAFPSSLETVRLPDSVTTMGSVAFARRGQSASSWYNNEKITQINYPVSLTEILPAYSYESYSGTAYSYASPFDLSAKSITVPEGVTTLPDYVFYGTDFEEIRLPLSLTKIGAYAFNWSDNIESLYLSPNINNIGEYAFSQSQGNGMIFDIYCVRNSYAWNYLNNNYSNLAHLKEWNGYVSLSAPTDFRLDAVSIDDHGINVSFLPVDGAAGYYVYYSTNSAFSSDYSKVEAVELDSGRWAGHVDGLEMGTRYYFWAAACNASGKPGYPTARVTTITSSLEDVVFSNQNTGAVLSDGQIVAWEPDDLFYLSYSGTGDNGTIEFRYYVMIEQPKFDETDLDHAVEFLMGSGTSVVDLPVSFFDPNAGYNRLDLKGYGGCYVKIYAALRDANYDVNKAAAGVEFAIHLNQSMARVTGTVTTADGTPLSGVYVAVMNTEVENDYHTIWTDFRGQWNLSLSKDASYQITYLLEGYEFSGTETFTAADGLSATALATLSGESNNNITFLMKQNGEIIDSIWVGTSVDFEVTAPETADMVRLVVDEVEYESYELKTNHKAVFSRLISSAGNGIRTVQFRIRENYKWTDLSRPKYLNVSKLDTPLGVPQISNLTEHIKGNPLTVSWIPVTDAEKYTVYVYSGSQQVWPYSATMPEYVTEPSFTIPANIFSHEGTYSIQVNAVATGYESSTGYKDIEVLSTDQKVMLRLSWGDVYSNVNSRRDFVINSCLIDPVFKVYITDPVDGTGLLDQYDGQNSFSHVFTHPGTYQIWATAEADGVIWTSNPITLNVLAVTLAMQETGSALGIGDVRTFIPDSSFEDAEYSVYMIEPDFQPGEFTEIGCEENSIVFPVQFSRPGNYQIWAVAQYGGESYTSEIISLTVDDIYAKSFSIIAYEKNIQTGKYKKIETLYEYGWEEEGTGLSFAVELNGSPKVVSLYDNNEHIGDMVQSSDDPHIYEYPGRKANGEMNAPLLLNNANTKHVYTMTWYDIEDLNGDSPINEHEVQKDGNKISIPIYCLYENLVDSDIETYYATTSFPFYRPLEIEYRQIPQGAEVKILNKTYTDNEGCYRLIQYNGVEGFYLMYSFTPDPDVVVYTDFLVADENSVQHIIEVNCNIEENQPILTGTRVRYDIETTGNPDFITYYVRYIPDTLYRQRYNDNSVTEFNSVILPESGKFVFEYSFPYAGIYEIGFEDNISGLLYPMNSVVAVNENTEYSIIYPESVMYPNHKIYNYPQRDYPWRQEVGTIKVYTPLEILYDAGNDFVYVKFTDADSGEQRTGYYDRSYQYSERRNIRGFLLRSDDIMHTHKLNNDPTDQFTTLMLNIGASLGFDNENNSGIYENVRTNNIENIINNIANNVTYRDITYIVIEAHGFSGGLVLDQYDDWYVINIGNNRLIPNLAVQQRFNFDEDAYWVSVYEESSVFYYEFTEWVNRIPGQVILILLSCNSGSINQPFGNNYPDLDIGRISVLASSSDNEESQSNIINGDYFLKKLNDEFANKVTTIKSLNDNCEEIDYFGLVIGENKTQHPVFLGEDDVVVFSPSTSHN